MIQVVDKISSKIIDELIEICGEDHVFYDSETLTNYSPDETEDLRFLPAVVIKPTSVEQISAIMKLANTELIPVTPRGAGTGLSGGALPIKGGISLSMEKFNKILEIDDRI